MAKYIARIKTYDRFEEPNVNQWGPYNSKAAAKDAAVKAFITTNPYYNENMAEAAEWKAGIEWDGQILRHFQEEEIDVEICALTLI